MRFDELLPDEDVVGGSPGYLRALARTVEVESRWRWAGHRLAWMIMSAVHLPDELGDRLAAEAAGRGISVDAFAIETLSPRFLGESPDAGAMRWRRS